MFVPFLSANGALAGERGCDPKDSKLYNAPDSTIWRDLRLICDRVDDSDVARLLAATPRGGLVVIDTWARAVLPGDENRRQDAGYAAR